MKKVSFIILTILMLLKCNFGYATGQIPDYLIQGKDTLALHSNPLETYFKDKPLKDEIIKVRSTALWRGYIAYFQIIDNKLVVQDIYKEDYFVDSNGKHQEKLISIYDIVFGEPKNFECNFYNGVLISPSGEMLNYVHMGYSSTYEKYHLFEIKDGNLVKQKNLSTEEFTKLKFQHFEHFKKTSEYKTMLDEMISSFKEMDEDISDSFGGLSKEEKKKIKKNKYLFEKEKEIEQIKSAQNFIFLFTSNNMKTIDLPN